jgi:hypothetical protein
MRIGWMLAIKEKIRRSMADYSRGMDIEEMISHMEGLDPKFRGKRCLNKKSSDDIVSGAQHSFGFPILWQVARC